MIFHLYLGFFIDHLYLYLYLYLYFQSRSQRNIEQQCTSSTYQKYGQHTINILNIPELWSTYQKYGQHIINMVNIPELWSTYQKYGQHTRNMVNIREIWSTHQNLLAKKNVYYNFYFYWTNSRSPSLFLWFGIKVKISDMRIRLLAF